MKILNRKRCVRFLAVTTSLILILTSNLISPVKVQAEKITYKASTAFNAAPGVQGQDQWYYQQLNETNFSNLLWDSVNWKWYGSQTNLAIYSTAMHPETNYDAVRKWVAPANGSIRIYGNVKKCDITGGDGVSVRIALNDTNIWGVNHIAYNDSVGLNYDFIEYVQAGDAIYFIVNKETTIYNDLTTWDPSIDFTSNPSGTTTYQASYSFYNGLGIQGINKWYYQQWDGSAYSNLTWDNTNGKWYGSQTNLVIFSTAMHPETNYDAVRKWVVPANGSIRIYGNVKKCDIAGGDGVSVRISLNDTNIWGPNHIAYNDSVGLNYDFIQYVQAGDVIYFIVNKETTIYNDLTTWDPSIDFTPSPTGTTTYQASYSFYNGCGIQGKNQWYYQQWNGSAYSNLTWDNTNKKWYGSQLYLSIYNIYMHPEANSDAIRKWVAPCNGMVRVYGNAKKGDTSGGDGVNLKIMQNDSTIWGPYYMAYNDSVGKNYDLTRQVKAGDAIYFSVNKSVSIYNDLTQWDPLVDFTPSSSGTNISEWNFTSSSEGWVNNNNTTVSTSAGYLNVTVNGANPSIISSYNLNIDITKSCILKVKYKNSTANTNAKIYFTTTEDINFTEAKSKIYTVNANDPNYTEYTIDMSGIYGWIGKLKQLIIVLNEASSGSCSIDYINLQQGGTNAPAFSLLDKEIVYDNNTLENTLNLKCFPDSIFGVVKNANASYNFYTSNGFPIQCTTLTSGTLDNPASTIIAKNKTILNTPADFGYICVGPVYRDPTDANTLMSFVHLERHYTVNNTPYFYSSLGIAITRDNGSTWNFCGEIIRPNITFDPSSPISYDIGGGSYIIKNDGGVDYFYVYAIDHSTAYQWPNGLSVSRAPVADVLAAAKNNTTTSWYKFYNGVWTQPGLNGNFTNIFKPNAHMNFMTVSYNTYIKKYIMAYVSAYQWGSNNYSDISLLIADSPTDFYNNTKEAIIDASNQMTTYPTIVGLGNNNPQGETQKNFYVYYTQFQNDQYWNSDTNLVRKMVILD